MVKLRRRTWLYRTVIYVPTATDQNVLGIAGFQDGYPGPAHLRVLMIRCRTDGVDVMFTDVQITAAGTTRAALATRRTSTCSTRRPWRTRLGTSSTAGCWRYLAAMNRLRATYSLSVSTT